MVRREWRSALVIGLLIVGGFVVALVMVFALLLTTGGWEDLSTAPPPFVGGAFIGTVIVWVALGFLGAIAIYIANGVATRSAVHGPPEGTSWDGLVPHIRPSAWASLRLFGWTLLLSLGFGAVFALLGIATVALGSVGDTAVFAVIPVILVMLGIFVLAVASAPFMFVTVALVYGEELPVLTAFAEARRLIRGRFWPSLGASLILFLFNFIPVLGGLAVALLQPFYMVGLLDELRATAT